MHSFSKEQKHALLEAARAYRVRDWLMILVALNHGLRVSEVLAITRDDFKDGILITQRLKGSDKTEQPLISHPDPLLDERTALSDFARNLAGNQRLFRIGPRRADQIIKQHARTAGVPEYLAHMHACKHTTAMEMIDSAKVPEIQKRLGHKSGSNTLKYLKVSDSQAADAFGRAIGAKRD